MSELTKEKIYKNELIKAGAEGNNNLARIRSLQNGGGGGKTSLSIPHSKPTLKTKTWVEKTFEGGTPNMDGRKLWTDGENIYYSDYSTQYIFNKEKSSFERNPYDWSNISAFYVWTDGENIYHTKENRTLVLNKNTHTWDLKTWNNENIYDGSRVWHYNGEVYYSDGTQHYVLDKENSAWYVKSWTGANGVRGNMIWTDGTNVYYSSGNTHLILNGTIWENAIISGNITTFSVDFVWTDGEEIYYTNGSSTYYKFDKGNRVWAEYSQRDFEGVGYVWTDGKHIYSLYNNTAKEFIIEESEKLHM